MIELHASKALFAKLPLDAQGHLPQQPTTAYLTDKQLTLTTNPLSNWQAHLFTLQRRQCVLWVHAATRFPLFMPCLTKPDFAALQWHFIDVFMNTLLKVGANEQHMNSAEQLLAPLHIDSVCDRSVQGTINQMRADIEHMLYFDRANITELSPRMTSAWLADRPCNIKGNKNGVWPQQAMLELLDNAAELMAAAPVNTNSSTPTPQPHKGDNIVSLANYRKGQHKQ